ncbi:MAG: response regulator transcription factor [Bacteroidales bacterium]|nr:response regulator transcription factor [Bacteroidales bacterium]
MIKTYIIEDEQPTLEAILVILNTNCKNVQVVGASDNVANAMDDIQKYKPELVLADINISGGTSFDIFENLDNINFKLIFITAFEEYALKAIKFAAIDYLVKPIDPLELIEAVQKAAQSIEKENTQVMLQSLLLNLGSKEKKFEQIVLKTSESIYLVNVKDITHIEADGSYTKFYFNDGRKIMVSKVIKEYDEMLSDSGFLRVHQSHMINLGFIDRFEKHDGGYVVLKDETIVPVSYRKKESLLNILENIGKSSA